MLKRRYPENLLDSLESEPFPELLLKKLDLFGVDPNLAISDLEVLAKNGSPYSMSVVGDLYVHQSDNEKIVEDGVDLFLKAAELGSVDGKYRLAKYYSEIGRYSDAVSLRIDLSERGYAPAMYLLGWMYCKGRGVRMDQDKAVEYWKKSEKCGHLRARRHLAAIYRSGSYGFSKIFIGICLLIKLYGPYIYYSIYYPSSDRLRT